MNSNSRTTPLRSQDPLRSQNPLRSQFVWISVIWLLAILIGVALRSGWMPALDVPILSWIRDHQIPQLQQVMYLITLAGYWPAYVLVLAVLAALLLPLKQWRVWLVLALNAGVTWGCNHLLKIIFQRQRPLDFFQMDQDGLSYPSGHAMVTVALYLLIALMVAKLWPRIKWLAVVIGISSFLPGLSRLFMGVHYPSDVLMGWLLGLASAWGWYHIWLKLESGGVRL